MDCSGPSASRIRRSSGGRDTSSQSDEHMSKKARKSVSKAEHTSSAAPIDVQATLQGIQRTLRKIEGTQKETKETLRKIEGTQKETKETLKETKETLKKIEAKFPTPSTKEGAEPIETSYANDLSDNLITLCGVIVERKIIFAAEPTKETIEQAKAFCLKDFNASEPAFVLSGPSGIGKTACAQIVAQLMSSTCKILHINATTRSAHMLYPDKSKTWCQELHMTRAHLVSTVIIDYMDEAAKLVPGKGEIGVLVINDISAKRSDSMDVVLAHAAGKKIKVLLSISGGVQTGARHSIPEPSRNMGNPSKEELMAAVEKLPQLKARCDYWRETDEGKSLFHDGATEEEQRKAVMEMLLQIVGPSWNLLLNHNFTNLSELPAELDPKSMAKSIYPALVGESLGLGDVLLARHTFMCYNEKDATWTLLSPMMLSSIKALLSVDEAKAVLRKGYLEKNSGLQGTGLELLFHAKMMRSGSKLEALLDLDHVNGPCEKICQAKDEGMPHLRKSETVSTAVGVRVTAVISLSRDHREMTKVNVVVGAVFNPSSSVHRTSDNLLVTRRNNQTKALEIVSQQLTLQERHSASLKGFHALVDRLTHEDLFPDWKISIIHLFVYPRSRSFYFPATFTDGENPKKKKGGKGGAGGKTGGKVVYPFKNLKKEITKASIVMYSVPTKVGSLYTARL